MKERKFVRIVSGVFVVPRGGLMVACDRHRRLPTVTDGEPRDEGGASEPDGSEAAEPAPEPARNA